MSFKEKYPKILSKKAIALSIVVTGAIVLSLGAVLYYTQQPPAPPATEEEKLLTSSRLRDAEGDVLVEIGRGQTGIIDIKLAGIVIFEKGETRRIGFGITVADTVPSKAAPGEVANWVATLLIDGKGYFLWIRMDGLSMVEGGEPFATLETFGGPIIDQTPLLVRGPTLYTTARIPELREASKVEWAVDTEYSLWSGFNQVLWGKDKVPEAGFMVLNLKP